MEETGEMRRIFVFGSNLAGRHGAGSALEAYSFYRAQYGVSRGPTGDAYAIPTKDARLRTLPLDKIQSYVDQFLEYARAHPELQFAVVRIGCGLAGYDDLQIAPMFIAAPDNCHLPDGWRVL